MTVKVQRILAFIDRVDASSALRRLGNRFAELAWVLHVRGVKELADDRDHSYHQQQELFLVVASRLAAMQNGRLKIRRRGGAGGRPGEPCRVIAAVAINPRAVPHASGHQDLGYAGDRRISQRGTAEGWTVADRSRRPRPLSLDLWGNALGIHQSAIGSADEP